MNRKCLVSVVLSALRSFGISDPSADYRVTASGEVWVSEPEPSPEFYARAQEQLHELMYGDHNLQPAQLDARWRQERRPRLPPAVALEVERLAAEAPAELRAYRERLRAQAEDLASFINCWRALGSLPKFRHNDVD